jgi:putative acetyltransferase
MKTKDVVEVRFERHGDEPAIQRVNDEAFGQPDESRIVERVRAAKRSLASLVAVEGATIVGHVLFTPITIEPTGGAVRAAGLGPIAVVPGLQRRGIGTALVEAGLRECARLGQHAVVVIGHPDFYSRFGFRPARDFGLRSQFDVPDDVFMAIELTPGALAGVAGRARYVPEFGGEDRG